MGSAGVAARRGAEGRRRVDRGGEENQRKAKEGRRETSDEGWEGLASAVGRGLSLSRTLFITPPPNRLLHLLTASPTPSPCLYLRLVPSAVLTCIAPRAHRAPNAVATAITNQSSLHPPPPYSCAAEGLTRIPNVYKNLYSTCRSSRSAARGKIAPARPEQGAARTEKNNAIASARFDTDSSPCCSFVVAVAQGPVSVVGD